MPLPPWLEGLVTAAPIRAAEPAAAGRASHEWWAGGSAPLRFSGFVGRAEANLALTVADGPVNETRGYVVEGASPRVRTRLALDGPVWEPLHDADLLPEGGQAFLLPHGVIGAGCGIAFVVGRTFPAEGEAVTRETLAAALVTCHLDIQVLSRTTTGTKPIGRSQGAINAALRLGPAIPHWQDIDLTAADLRVSLDGNVVAQGERDRDPLDAALWLAEMLGAQDRALEAGDIVATGSRVGVLQVLPRQTLTVRSGGLGGLALTFV